MQQAAPYYPILLQQDSPLRDATESIKNYFNTLTSKVKQFPKLQHGFQSKPSPKHICTKILKPTQKYFHCQVCSIDSDQDTMIFCSDCFDVKLHEGHTYQQKIVENNKCSCDCGRKLRIKKQSICITHANKIKQVQLDKEQLQKFVSYFSKWFEIVFYLKDKQVENIQIQPLLKILASTLIQLCQSSLYYVRMIRQLFNRQLILNGKKYKLKEEVFKFIAFCPLIIQMIGDQQCLLEFGEIFDKIQKQCNIAVYPIYYFSPLRKQLLSSQLFLLQMSKKGIYFTQCFHHYFEIVSQCESQEQKSIKIYQLLKNMLKSMDQNEYLTTLFQIFKTGDTSLLNSVEMCNQIYERAIKSFTIDQASNDDQKEDNNQQPQEDLKRKIMKSSFLVVKMIYHRCDNKIQNVSKWIQKIYSDQAQKQKFQNFIEFIIKKNAFNQLLITSRRRAALLILLALQKHTKKQKLLNKFWLQIIDMQKNLSQNLDKIYDLVGFLANSYRTFPILGINQQQNKLSQEQIRRNLLKSQLYEAKQISKRQLWGEYIDGWLKNINAGQIINSLCKYNDAHDTFTYSSSQNYPNKLTAVPESVNRNWENVRKLDITYDSPNIGQSKMLKGIFLSIFQTQAFFNLFQQNFIKALEMLEKQARTLQKWKQKRIGENYILLLLIIDKLCHGEENFFMKDDIDKIKNNTDQYRFRFTEIGMQENIKKILCVDPPVQEKIQQNNQQNKQKQVSPQKQKQKNQQQLAKQQMKRKAQAKKQLIQNKMKQKQQTILQKLKNQKSSYIQQQQQQNFCLSCKQRQKKDNQFVYMIHLLKGSTISKILHGQESKTSSRIKTNLHAIHMKCFLDTKKKNMQFQCQLCKQQINCFLPYKPNRATKKSLEICWNVINALLVSVYNIYDTGCLFSILFQSLIQSLGFNQLLSARKSKALYKAKQKSDRYLLQLLMCLYSFGSPQQQQKYNTINKQLRQRIKTCTKKQLQLFQLVILDACFERISGTGSIDQKMLEELGKVMYEQQLNILKNILQFFTEGSTDLSSLSFISMENIQSEKQVANQLRGQIKIDKVISFNEIKQQLPQNTKTNIMTEGTPLMTKQSSKGIQRKMLGINIISPPKTIKELSSPKFLQSWTQSKQSKCSSCEGSQVKVLCLLCRRIFCEKCQQDEFHSQMHLGNIITLNIKTGTVSIEKGGKTQSFDLYFNQFMIEYKKAKKDIENDSSQDNEESQIAALFRKKKKQNKKIIQDICEFKLNQVKFNELLEKFYNLSA